MNILTQIIQYKKQEVEVRKILVPVRELVKSSLFKRECLSLIQFLLDPAKNGIIAEFKRKSPSKGFINKDADVKKITNAYTKMEQVVYLCLQTITFLAAIRRILLWREKIIYRSSRRILLLMNTN